LLCFGAATALMLWARPRRRRVSPIGRARRWTLALALALTVAAGCLGFPAWASLVAGIGLGIGLEPLPPRAPGAGGPLLWLATVVLAPVFEEILYRERLLLDLRGAMGAPCALAASTFAFAISHLDAWSVLATACIGLALGVLALVTRCVWLCVALHAGLNLASVLQGAPPVRLAPALATSAALGWTLLLSAVGLSLGTRSTQTPGPPEPR
jgi:membrane protease YdiL (CAAX protease family)